MRGDGDMIDNEGARSRFIRARQRDRNSSMIGFASDLSPTLEQVGVDRLMVSITGQWSSSAPNGRSLFDNALHFPEVPWFNRASYTPSTRPNSVSLAMSRRSNTSTISKCEFKAWPLNGRSGQFKVGLSLNPTRTLAHLLARFGEGGREADQRGNEGFASFLRSLPPSSFFLQAEPNCISPSLDGSDNWLPPTRQVADQVGRDFWPIFLQIYAYQVRSFCVSLLCMLPSSTVEETVDLIGLNGGSARLDWSEIRVPQIECYIERYHRDAIATVRRGGWAVLSADHSAELRAYSGDATFTRENDRFAIGLTISDRYKLAMYAKRADRIRFEVRRIGKGNYSDLRPATTPTMRMLDIIEHERAQLLTRVGWSDVGELLAGPDHPQLHDLAELIEQVASAVDSDAAIMSAVLKALLLEGALSEGSANHNCIQRLVRQGVLERARVRRRDINNRSTRYVLRAPYRDIHALLADPLR